MWGIAMKKKVDKDKRKILKYAMLSVVVMYISSLIMLFFGIYHQEAQLFDREVGQITSFSKFNDDEYYQGANATTENFIPQYFYESYSYYSAIALYDENGELVHTNGTILAFFDENKMRYCYLDEFISKEDYNNILKLNDENDGNISCESFKYYENENNEIIPVEFVLCGTKNEKEIGLRADNEKQVKTYLKLEFSEYTGETVEVTDDFLQLQMREIYGLENPVERYLYRKLIAQVKSEKDKEFGYNNFKNNDVEALASGGGYIGGHDACYDISFKLQEVPYFAVIRVEYNPLIKILTDGLFYTMAVFFTISSLIIFLIIRHYISVYYDKNRKLEEAKNTLTSATAHELKTPISIIQNQCECIMENIAPEKNREYIESIYNESQRMNKIVGDFLQYNRLVQAEDIILKETDLTLLVKEEVAKYQEMFKQNQKSIKLDLCDSAFVKVNPEMIRLVINNFFSNAVKHSGVGGEIVIKLERVTENKLLKFSVYNSGSEIEESLQSNVWEVLYKTDQARTEKGTSGGMGLAIASRILELHKFSHGCKNVKNGVEFWFFI